MRKEIVEREHDMVRELGYDSYTDLWNRIDDLQLDKLEKRIEDFLQQTESLYERSFGALIQTHFQIPLQEMKSWDVHRIARAPQFDPFFPADNMLNTFRLTAKQIGIDFDKQGILLDLEARETKSAVPFCSPIEVPNRVVLVMTPLQGYYGYKALFHEGGHALHYSSIDSKTPFESACLVSSDYAIPETFSTLFELMLFDPCWLDTHLFRCAHTMNL